MFRVTFWLQWLPLILIIRQSASVSDQCSELREEIDRVRKLSHRNDLLVAQCYEQLKTESHISEAAFRSLKLAEDEFNYKLQQSEAFNSILKKELQAKDQVLKSNSQKQEQLQAAIDGLKKTVESVNQTVQRVCRYLLEAAKSGDVNTTKVLVKCTSDNCTDDGNHRLTPLMYAADEGHVVVVRVLLEGGAITDRVDDYGSTALHHAAWKGRRDVCSLLLDWGAEVDPLNRRKYTPLHDAAHWGYLSVVKLLVERGADVSLKNNSGQTASDVARSNGKKDVAEWLDSVGSVKVR